MKSVLLIGLGRFGMNALMKLEEMNHEVLAVDQNEERVEDVLPYVTDARIGDTTDEVFLSSLGVDNFDVCIVAIGDDFQSSLETTYLLKEMGALLVVSRASSDFHARFLQRNGADHVVYPEKQLAEWTAIRYSSDHVLDYIALSANYSIFEVSVPEGWVGRTVRDVDIRKKYHINIVAVKDNDHFHPEVLPDYRFTATDTLLVIGHNKNIQKCFRL